MTSQLLEIHVSMALATGIGWSNEAINSFKRGVSTSLALKYETTCSTARILSAIWRNSKHERVRFRRASSIAFPISCTP